MEIYLHESEQNVVLGVCIVHDIMWKRVGLYVHRSYYAIQLYRTLCTEILSPFGKYAIHRVEMRNYIHLFLPFNGNVVCIWKSRETV